MADYRAISAQAHCRREVRTIYMGCDTWCCEAKIGIFIRNIWEKKIKTLIFGFAGFSRIINICGLTLMNKDTKER